MNMLRTRIWVMVLTGVMLFAKGAAAQQSSASPGYAHVDGSGPHIDLHLNVAGFLQFGPTAALEVGAEKLSGLVRFRIFNWGLLANEIPDEDSAESFAFSYGAALGGRYYGRPELGGFFAGVMIEYLRLRNEDEKVDKEAYLTSLVIPQGELGYRFRFGDFLVGLGGAFGYAIVTSADTEDLSGGADPILRPNDAENEIYGSALVEVGWFF